MYAESNVQLHVALCCLLFILEKQIYAVNYCNNKELQDQRVFKTKAPEKVTIFH